MTNLNDDVSAIYDQALYSDLERVISVDISLSGVSNTSKSSLYTCNPVTGVACVSQDCCRAQYTIPRNEMTRVFFRMYVYLDKATCRKK